MKEAFSIIKSRFNTYLRYGIEFIFLFYSGIYGVFLILIWSFGQRTIYEPLIALIGTFLWLIHVFILRSQFRRKNKIFRLKARIVAEFAYWLSFIALTAIISIYIFRIPVGVNSGPIFITIMEALLLASIVISGYFLFLPFGATAIGSIIIYLFIVKPISLKFHLSQKSTQNIAIGVVAALYFSIGMIVLNSIDFKIEALMSFAQSSFLREAAKLILGSPVIYYLSILFKGSRFFEEKFT